MTRLLKLAALVAALSLTPSVGTVAAADATDGKSPNANRVISDLRDMRVEAANAKKTGSLIVLIATIGGCDWCELVKSDFLNPLLASGELDNVAVVRELHLDGLSITTNTGESLDPVEFANRYDARFSPTVIFLSPEGRVLHEPIVGVQSRDYYGFYLEKAIAKAARVLKADS